MNSSSVKSAGLPTALTWAAKCDVCNRQSKTCFEVVYSWKKTVFLIKEGWLAVFLVQFILKCQSQVWNRTLGNGVSNKYDLVRKNVVAIKHLHVQSQQ